MKMGGPPGCATAPPGRAPPKSAAAIMKGLIALTVRVLVVCTFYHEGSEIGPSPSRRYWDERPVEP